MSAGTVPFRLNPSLDLTALAKRFAAGGRLQIGDFLAEGALDPLSDELATNTRWRRIINGGSTVFEIPSADYDALPAEQHDTLNKAVMAGASKGFQYRYDTIRVPDDPADRAHVPDRLDAFVQFLNAPETMRALRRITDDDSIAFADAQATRYRTGDFLTRHDDDIAGKNRRFAYVLTLSPSWQPEWGGLLLFTTADGALIEAIAPRFNALSLFKVPQPHSVSMVAPYAHAPRLSVTGWLRSRPPSGG